MRKATILILFFLLCTSCLSAFAGDTDAASQAGKNSATNILNQLHSSNDIQNRIVNPLTTSDTKMKTYGTAYECSTTHALFPDLSECQAKCRGGSCSEYQGFNAQVEAPSTNAFLKIQILPNGATNDFQIIVRQDTDMDGHFDHNFTPVFRTGDGATTRYASGACTHGVVVCSPGTWNNCTYYVWEADTNGYLNLKQVSNNSSQLGTCYCVNNSCGGILMQNVSQVLDTVGAGAAMVLAEARSIAISQATKDLSELSVSFYGQESSGISHAPDTVYETGPSQTYTSPETLESAYSSGVLPTDEEIATQSSDPNSYYSLMTNSVAMENESVSTYTCTIRHDVIGNQKTEQIGSSGSGTWGTDHYLKIRIYQDGSKIRFQWLNTGPGGEVCKHNCGPCSWTDVGSVDLNALPQNGRVTEYYFHARHTGGNCPDGSGTATFLNQTVTLTGACGANRCQYPTVYWEYYVEYSYDELHLNTTGGCHPDDTCRLKEEQICDPNGQNCVYTVQNYTPTGITPLPSCKTVNGTVSYTVCNDGRTITAQYDGNTITVASGDNLYWYIKRTYICESNKEYNPDLTSAKEAYSTADPSTGKYTQKVMNRETKTYETTTQNVPLNLFPEESNQCEMACVVTIEKTDTTAYPEGGNKATTTTSPTTKQFIVKKCVQDSGGNWHCPLEVGETHYKPADAECGCIDMFAETVSALQAVYDAAHDMICSSEPPD